MSSFLGWSACTTSSRGIAASSSWPGSSCSWQPLRSRCGRPSTSRAAASSCRARARRRWTRRSPTSRTRSARRSPSCSRSARARRPRPIRAEVDRVDRIAAEVDHAELTPAAAREAKARAGKDAILVIPLDLEGSQDQLADVAVDMRDELDVGQVARRRRAAPRRPAGALGRDAGALEGGPRGGRDDRLPDRPPDPARGVRLAGRCVAAARARLRQRPRQRRRRSTSSRRRPRCRSSSRTSRR